MRKKIEINDKLKSHTPKKKLCRRFHLIEQKYLNSCTLYAQAKCIRIFPSLSLSLPSHWICLFTYESLLVITKMESIQAIRLCTIMLHIWWNNMKRWYLRTVHLTGWTILTHIMCNSRNISCKRWKCTCKSMNFLFYSGKITQTSAQLPIVVTHTHTRTHKDREFWKLMQHSTFDLKSQ